MNKIVAIHQPNFFPWLGYFSKIASSDVFIFFDDVQFSKTGGTWSNRVKLLVAGEAKWVTGAIDRNFHGVRAIREMSYQANIPWRERLIKTLEANYRRHPYFEETMAVIEELILNPEHNVARYNIHGITVLCRQLGLDVSKLHRSSDIPHEGASNELLCSLTKAVGGDIYMCGAGADGYQEEAIFRNLGIQLKFQSFVHPTYTQMINNDFVAGLSLIDAAMNLGWRGTSELIIKA